MVITQASFGRAWYPCRCAACGNYAAAPTAPTASPKPSTSCKTTNSQQPQDNKAISGPKLLARYAATRTGRIGKQELLEVSVMERLG